MRGRYEMDRRVVGDAVHLVEHIIRAATGERLAIPLEGAEAVARLVRDDARRLGDDRPTGTVGAHRHQIIGDANTRHFHAVEPERAVPHLDRIARKADYPLHIIVLAAAWIDRKSTRLNSSH